MWNLIRDYIGHGRGHGPLDLRGQLVYATGRTNHEPEVENGRKIEKTGQFAVVRVGTVTKEAICHQMDEMNASFSPNDLRILAV